MVILFHNIWWGYSNAYIGKWLDLEKEEARLMLRSDSRGKGITGTNEKINPRVER